MTATGPFRQILQRKRMSASGGTSCREADIKRGRSLTQVGRACPYVRLGTSRVSVSVMGWCPIGFPIALDGGALNLEIVLGRRAPKWDVRHIDSIVLTF